MANINDLFTHNRAWAAEMERTRPGFFTGLVKQQTPKFMWIGCADSRVPANEIVGLMPGELFVHRNVANVVVHTDLNCLSVLQYAVDVLAVHHVIVCGHYDCGGVRAAYLKLPLGLIDNWLRHVQDVRERHQTRLAALEGDDARIARLCELNVVDQVRHVAETTIVRDAWQRGQALTVHGWIYDVHDGLLRDLGCTASNAEELAAAYDRATTNMRGRTEARA